MRLMVENREKPGEISEYRCRDFVSATLYIDGEPVPLSDTVGGRYRLVEATHREREVLKCWGYQLEGL